MRDGETGSSKGYGFVSYDNFESSDAALSAMNGNSPLHLIIVLNDFLTTIIGQFFANKTINVMYAYKKDTKGERHGSAAGIYYY